MKKTSFNSGWQMREKINPFDEVSSPAAAYEDVTLPHDALIGRDRTVEGRPANAFFPSATVQYRRSLTLPDEARNQRLLLEFEGVYRDAMVYINGAFAGQRPSGYAAFTIDMTPYLKFDADNEILVEARAHEDSRWYTGAGIYRNVWLLQGDQVHIVPNGLTITTLDMEPGLAVIEVSATVATLSSRLATARIDVTIMADDRTIVASGSVPTTAAPGQPATSRQRLYVQNPKPWSAETPQLYTATVVVRTHDGPVLDEVHQHFGIRTLQLDPIHGLRINGTTVELRGTCLHHDNGILGSATFTDADERRVRILKEAGFNAIRSAHNPISTALLEACDRIGMYVMDETFDMWTSTKSGFDYGLAFPTWWQADLLSMVEKDRNHPSVIMYCIGNEIPETGSPAGGITGRHLAEELRRLDPTRYITNGVNGLLAVMSDLKQLSTEHGPGGALEAMGINTIMTTANEYFNAIGSSDLVTQKTEESFGLLDIAGLNYLDVRYEQDAKQFPNRLIIGTETYPWNIDRNWALVKKLPQVLGDFTWTGWDYLGEVGIGRSAPVSDDGLSASYPWIAAWCGDIDITGHRRPASYYREIVFGRRITPYIAVLRPGNTATGPFPSAWAWTDSVSSWTWNVDTGSELVVEVYSHAAEVELLLNGRVIDRKCSGPDQRYRTAFTVPYEPGELTAVAYTGDSEQGRHSLNSAVSSPTILATIDPAHETVVPGSLVFLDIEIVDEAGTVLAQNDTDVNVSVSGAGVLQALGSANPKTATLYNGMTTQTFDGRALAIVRATTTGEIRVQISAAGYTATYATVIDVGTHEPATKTGS
ncbi:glycoside hydrolase family 2 TIM barrel-domain containing protein [Arthrobacter sp. MDB2-24]